MHAHRTIQCTARDYCKVHRKQHNLQGIDEELGAYMQRSVVNAIGEELTSRQCPKQIGLSQNGAVSSQGSCLHRVQRAGDQPTNQDSSLVHAHEPALHFVQILSLRVNH